MSTSPLSLAEQNDAFRRGLLNSDPYLGIRTYSQGIGTLSRDEINDIWAAVRRFNAFTEDNDPHGEHDFGSLDHPRAGIVFWKIDYYDLALEQASEDPSDPAKTKRVLTVMLASEY